MHLIHVVSDYPYFRLISDRVLLYCNIVFTISFWDITFVEYKSCQNMHAIASDTKSQNDLLSKYLFGHIRRKKLYCLQIEELGDIFPRGFFPVPVEGGSLSSLLLSTTIRLDDRKSRKLYTVSNKRTKPMNSCLLTLSCIGFEPSTWVSTLCVLPTRSSCSALKRYKAVEYKAADTVISRVRAQSV